MDRRNLSCTAAFAVDSHRSDFVSVLQTRENRTYEAGGRVEPASASALLFVDRRLQVSVSGRSRHFVSFAENVDCLRSYRLPPVMF